MPNFPFFRFSYPNQYYPYYHNYNKTLYSNANNLNNNLTESIEQEETRNKEIENLKYKKRTSKYNSFGPIHFANLFNETNLEEPILEILGIELYLDDLIILGLLFFLYKEEVHDEMLFLSLILLLLT